MNDMDNLRLTIMELGRNTFTAKELIEEHNYSVFVYKQIGKMVKGGEIVKVSDDRPSKFKVIKLKDIATVRRDKRIKKILKKNDVQISSPWANIFPEFYTQPQFQGTSRFVLNFTE